MCDGDNARAMDSREGTRCIGGGGEGGDGCDGCDEAGELPRQGQRVHCHGESSSSSGDKRKRFVCVTVFIQNYDTYLSLVPTYVQQKLKSGCCS